MSLRHPCCFVFLMLLAPVAVAWGPATHAHLAERITGVSHPDLLYGAMATDVSAAVTSRWLRPPFASLTHAEINALEPGNFATGFATHNGRWGTDFYIHRHHNPDAPEIWSTRKIRQFSEEFGVDSQIGEGLLDITIEYLVRLERGPEFGAAVVESAQDAHGPELIEAFAEPLAKRAGIPPDRAEREVRRAAHIFQVLMRTYGRLLCVDEDYLRYLGDFAVVVLTGHGLKESRRIFARMVAVCSEDYEAELDRVCASVRERMQGIPKYSGR